MSRGIYEDNDVYLPPTNYEKLVYTPKLSLETSEAIRRLSWYMETHMTKAIKALINAIPAIIEPLKICSSCKDKTDCKNCIFSHQYTEEEKIKLLTVLNIQKEVI